MSRQDRRRFTHLAWHVCRLIVRLALLTQIATTSARRSCVLVAIARRLSCTFGALASQLAQLVGFGRPWTHLLFVRLAEHILFVRLRERISQVLQLTPHI